MVVQSHFIAELSFVCHIMSWLLSIMPNLLFGSSRLPPSHPRLLRFCDSAFALRLLRLEKTSRCPPLFSCAFPPRGASRLVLNLLLPMLQAVHLHNSINMFLLCRPTGTSRHIFPAPFHTFPSSHRCGKALCAQMSPPETYMPLTLREDTGVRGRGIRRCTVDWLCSKCPLRA